MAHSHIDGYTYKWAQLGTSRMAFHTSGRTVVMEVTYTQWPGVIPKDHPWLTRTLMDTHTNDTYTMAWGDGEGGGGGAVPCIGGWLVRSGEVASH